MASVHPLFVVEVADDVNLTNRRPGNTEKDAVEEKADYEDDSDDDDMKFPGEIYADRNALLESLNPLIVFLRIFGLYFKQKNVKKRQQNADAIAQVNGLADSTESVLTNASSKPISENNAAKKFCESLRMRWHPSKIYSVFILALLWGNVARYMLVFTGSEGFEAPLINKLTTLAWMLLAAIMQTSCVVACWSGRFDRVLRELRVTEEFANSIRKKSKISTYVAVFFFTINIIFVAVTTFIEHGQFQNMYAPFYSFIHISGRGVFVVKAAYLMVAVYIVSAWMIPQASNNMLAMVICLQYYALNKKFLEAIDETGKFNGNLRTFRRRHQALCRAVKRADNFVMISNVAGFICHMSTVILYLYSLIRSSSVDVLTNAAFYYYFILNAAGLILTTANGIAVNEMVSLQA